jgi:hypothetical protein
MGTTSITYLPGQLEAAAATVATAALAPINPVLTFSAADLHQVGAHEATDDRTVPKGAIAVSPPDDYMGDEDLASVCAHRIRKALLVAGHAGGRLGEIGMLDLVRAVSALVGAARRRECPSEWVALRIADLREVDLAAAQIAEPRAAGGVIWIPLGGLPSAWTDAVAAARERIEAALRGGPTDLLGVPLAAAPAPRIAA